MNERPAETMSAPLPLAWFAARWLQWCRRWDLPLQPGDADAMAWARILRHGLGAWPLALADQIGQRPSPAARTAADRVRRAEAWRQEWLQQILTGFTDAGLQAHPLKGDHWRSRLWPDPQLRPAEDIDLWLPPESLAAAAARLRALGYAPIGAQPSRGNFEWHFVRDGAPLVELHWELSAWWRSGWQAAWPAEAGSALDETMARHALAHFAQHKGVLRAVQEIELLALGHRGLPTSLPGALRRPARLWQARRHHFWEAPADEASALPEPPAWVRRYYRAAAPQPLANTPGRLGERLLGLWLAGRRRGWWAQLAGRLPAAPQV